MRLRLRRQWNDDKLQALSANRAFAYVRPRRLAELARLFDQASAPAGTVLVEGGRLNHAFYLLVDGIVEVSRRGEHQAFLHAGDFFGKLTMDTLEPSRVSVVAVTPVKLLVAGHDQYRSIVALTRPSRLAAPAAEGRLVPVFG